MRPAIRSIRRRASPATRPHQVTPQTQSRDTVDKTLLNQSNIFAKFETGAIRHDADRRLRDLEATRAATSCAPSPPATPPTCSIRTRSGPWVGTITDLPGEVVRAKTDTVAAYLFDTVHFSEQLLVTGGLRWERNKSEFNPAPSQITAAVQPIERNDSYLTWRAGLTYKPIQPQPLCRRRHVD